MSGARAADVVLLNTGYFRLVGSHNDRMPLSLCYLSTHLDAAGIGHRVFNAEFTGSGTYWSWEHLFDRFHLLRDAVDGRSPVFAEVAERVLDYAPEVVVVGCGDPLLASVGLANPHAACQQARALRAAGVRHVYFFGPYATLDAETWLATGLFDGVLQGGPAAAIGDVVRERRRGLIALGPADTDVLPSFAALEPAGQRCDVLLTSFGCAWRCSFCLSPRIEPRVRLVPCERVVEDVLRRPPGRLYLGDMVFALDRKRLRELAAAFEAAGVDRTFVCENRVDVIDDERCALMRRMGIVATKLGIESVDAGALSAMNKATSREQAERAIACLRRHGIGVVLYVMVGGPGCSDESLRATCDWVEQQDPDGVVVSTWSDDSVGSGHAFRFDAHFSPDCLSRWNVSDEWFRRLLSLQKRHPFSKLDRVV